MLACPNCFAVVRFQRDTADATGQRLEEKVEKAVGSLLPKALVEVREETNIISKIYKKSSLVTERTSYRRMLRQWVPKWEAEMQKVKDDPAAASPVGARAREWLRAAGAQGKTKQWPFSGAVPPWDPLEEDEPTLVWENARDDTPGGVPKTFIRMLVN